VYPGDDDPRAVHVAALVGARGEVAAVGSMLPEEPPWPGPTRFAGNWRRIRGMATGDGRRGRGLGRAVLDELLRHAVAGDGDRAAVWCNARIPAVAFYRRAGFAEVGESFDVPFIGEHQAMRLLPPP
jgi:GNAT superfamily N-acetyltransferase